jgi:Fur family transcriptional regulator, ferric uptake regulator
MKRRNTPAKNTILSILNSVNKAVSQEDIENEVKGTMDRVTIYRVLNGFCSDGLVHKILADDGKTYFALCQNCEEHQHTHNHFHFRCMKCGNLECLKF